MRQLRSPLGPRTPAPDPSTRGSAPGRRPSRGCRCTRRRSWAGRPEEPATGLPPGTLGFREGSGASELHDLLVDRLETTLLPCRGRVRGELALSPSHPLEAPHGGRDPPDPQPSPRSAPPGPFPLRTMLRSHRGTGPLGTPDVRGTEKREGREGPERSPEGGPRGYGPSRLSESWRDAPGTAVRDRGSPSPRQIVWSQSRTLHSTTAPPASIQTRSPSAKLVPPMVAGSASSHSPG